MSRSKQAGFTLIELMIVMAITAGMAAIVFTGQRSLRSQAQFDADVDKLVVSVAEVHNEATAGVNIVGAGNGTNPCPGGGASPTVYAGEALSADNSLPGSAFKVDYYKANPGNAACIFDTRSISVPSSLQVNGTPGRELFVRTSSGGLDVCPVTNLATDVRPSFAAGSCASASWTIKLQDSDGHSSQIIIDSSGLAKRVN